MNYETFPVMRLAVAVIGLLVLVGVIAIGRSLFQVFRPGSKDHASGSEAVADVVRAIAAVGIAIVGVVILVELYVNMSPGFVLDVAREHFLAVIGAPMAAMAALFMVLVLRATAGPIEFEAVGVKVKGAAGPLLFWILCFLSMVVAMRLLW